MRNGIAWTAGLDIPDEGVPSETPTFEQLLENQDYAKPEGFDEEKARATYAPQ